jgi:hypothetical protein
MTVTEINQLITRIEEKAGADLDENRDQVLADLKSLCLDMKNKGEDDYRMFRNQVMDVAGGVYIPYIFWMELSLFFKNTNHRTVLFDVIKAFCNSAFEDEEKKKMKPLLITYFANEKEFEMDKIQGLIVDKAHPSIREYFQKITSFVTKNKNSTGTYLEKFRILMEDYPDFELLNLPVSKLKDIRS